MKEKPMKNWLSKKDYENPMAGFQKEMNQLFNNFFTESPFAAMKWNEETFNPKVNVAETDTNVQITAELPGMEEKDIDVSLAENTLTIKGEKKKESEEKNKNFHRVERSYGYFQRSLPLPAEVEVDKVAANFKNGILNITLPKSQASKAKSKKIEIKS